TRPSPAASTRPRSYDRLQPSFVPSPRPIFVPVYAAMLRRPYRPTLLRRVAGDAHLLYVTDRTTRQVDAAPSEQWTDVGEGFRFRLEHLDPADRPAGALVATVLFDKPALANSLELFLPPTLLEVTMADDAGRPISRRSLLLNIRSERNDAPVGMATVTFVPAKDQKPRTLTITAALHGEDRPVPFVIENVTLP